MKILVITKDLQISERLKELSMFFPDDKFIFSFDYDNSEEEAHIYLITEDESFEKTEPIIQTIQKNVKKQRAVIIVIGENHATSNIVNWMRAGVADFIALDKLNETTIRNSITTSIKYIHGDRTPIQPQQNKHSYGKKVIIKKGDWKKLHNNTVYPMSLVLVSILIPQSFIDRYSKEVLEKINALIREEMHVTAEKFGGSLWFWNNESGILAFHFGDHHNAATLASIYLMGHFFLYCIEKLNLNEILPLKISIHEGPCLYNKANTEQITSDMINTLYHMQNQYNTANNCVISEDIYTSLSNRLNFHFSKADYFEGKQLYRLQRNACN